VSFVGYNNPLGSFEGIGEVGPGIGNRNAGCFGAMARAVSALDDTLRNLFFLP
jgi:hypothetical protein